MLADQYTTIFNQFVSALFLSSLIIPGTGKGYFHGSARANRTCAKEIRSISGDNLCIGVSSNISHLSLILGDLTVLDHLIQFHTCCDTSKITSIIDRSECIVEVVQTLGMSLGSGCMAELYFRILFCSLDHIILMSKAVCKNEITSCICKLAGCIVALLSFRNIGFCHILNTHFLTSSFCCVHEVQVISRVLIMQENETSFQSSGGCLCGISISCLFGCCCVSAVCGISCSIRTAGSTSCQCGGNQCHNGKQTYDFLFHTFSSCFSSSEALMRLAYNVTGYFVKRR